MKLIDKDALVAEINKRISRNKERKEWEDIPEKRHQLIIEGQLLGELKYFLNSLEVKEVDLEKIINDYFKDWKFDDELDIMVKPNNYSASFIDLKDIAKHFFELGLLVSNKTQKGE